MRPWVTVVIPVHNSLPYLEDTLASVYHQSLERRRVEVIAVDDGSTDGSGESLATWAARWPQLQVITQRASGGAGKPRNVGIERASGEYLFFLDSDDCLGPAALERLLAYARENESDVVLARLVGIGRSVPSSIFKEDQPHAGLRSGIYYTLMPFKLVRRSLVMEQGIRFPEHIRVSEDQYFVAACYLAASVISVLGSYPAYYLVRREDGSNTSFEGLSYAEMVSQADETVQLIRERTTPGAEQAYLVARHVRLELLRRVQTTVLGSTTGERDELVRTGAPFAEGWAVEGLGAELAVHERLLLEALKRRDVDRVVQVVRWSAHGQRAEAVHEAGQWFLAAPGFREGDGYPDELFSMAEPPIAVTAAEHAAIEGSTLTVSGHAFIRGIPAAACEIVVSMQHVGSDEVVQMDVTRAPTPFLNAVEGGTVSYADAGFRGVLQLDSQGLRKGRWRLVVTVQSPHLSASRNLRPPLGFAPMRSEIHREGAPTNFVLRVGDKANLVLGVKLVVPRPDPSRRSRLTRLPGRLRSR